VTPSRARLAALALSLTTSLSGCPEPPAPPAPPPSAQEQQERDSLYALGTWLARNLAGIQLEEKDMAPLAEGLSDALLGRTLRVDPVEVGERVQGFLNERRGRMAASEKSAGASFVAAARDEPGARRTVSGAIYLDLVEGTGDSPKLSDRVKLHYRGIRRDGSSFDDSYARDKPEAFGVNRVIPCWMEALQLMKPGGKARVTCSSDLAYGDRGLAGRVLPGAPLQFELELLEILPANSARP
jgi:FKBP-type peptidyl-prolyl cis-trans isomerase FkpA